MEEEDVLSLHRLFEAANPRSVKGENLTKALDELYQAVQKNFDKLYKRPDGSRAFQLLFRRGSEELRNQLLDDFKSKLLELSTTKFSYHIVASMIKNGNSAQRGRVFDGLKGNFDTLLSHKIGSKIIDVLFANTNQEQKTKMFLDFYGAQWKKQTKVLTLEDICKQGGTVKSAAIKSLVGHLRRAIDKGFGRMKITQKLLMILGQNEPKELGAFATDFKEYAWSLDGSQAAIIAIQNARQNEIKMSLKLLDGAPRKSVIPTGMEGVAVPEAAAVEEEEEEEEEAAEDNGEEDQGENEGQNNGENEEEVVDTGNTTTQLAMDNFAWRALLCAISYNDDFQVIKDEVLPNLFDYWHLLHSNKNALKLFLRLVSDQPSVFHDMTFTKGAPPEELVNCVLPTLSDHMLGSIKELGNSPDGRALIATVMKVLEADPKFARFAESVFIPEYVVDKVYHKLIRSCIQIIGKEASKLALDTVNQAGLSEVLKTPGAWIVKEIIPGNKKLESQAKSIIKKEKIEGPAIQSILHPSQQKKEDKPKKRGPKK